MDSPIKTREEPILETILTPRSKVKALLAELDDDDSDTSTAPKSNEGKGNNAGKSNRIVESSESSGDDDASPLPLPRGRLAARLKSATSKKAASNAGMKSSADHDFSGNNSESENQPPATVSASRPTLRRRLFTKTKDGRSASPQALQFMSKTRQSPNRPDFTGSVSSHGDARARQSKAQDQTASTSGVLPNVSMESAGDDESVEVRDNSRFLELVAMKRAEREARESLEEAAREATRQAKVQRLQQSSDRLDELLEQDGDADGEDTAAGEAMTSHMKPSRKAGKKALEAMNRETQRLSRNQQLAHAATTRKRYSVASLFSRFGSNDLLDKPSGETLQIQQQPASSDPLSPNSSSRVEGEAVTPPTSPAIIQELSGAFTKEPSDLTSKDATIQVHKSNHPDRPQPNSVHLEDEPPSINNLFDANDVVKVTGHGCYTVTSPAARSRDQQGAQGRGMTLPRPHKKLSGPNFRVQPVKSATTDGAALTDSGDDLDIVVPRKVINKFTHLLNRPVQEALVDSKSRLKSLAHLSSPSKRAGRSTVSAIPIARMYADLMAQARKQAASERVERIQELRAKGVVIQTPEERERDQMVTEDLLEKARKENEELTKREREETKREGGASNLMDLEDSDDESYVASNDEQLAEDADAEAELDAEDSGVNYSGSEDEEEENEQEAAGVSSNGLFEEEASEDESDAIDFNPWGSVKEGDSAGEEVPLRKPHRGRSRRVLDDDDENDSEPPPGLLKSTQDPVFPTIVNPFARTEHVKNFETAMPMALSQAFAATMDDSQNDDNDLRQSSAVLTPPVPEPDLPVHDTYQIARDHAKAKDLDLVFADQVSTGQELLTQGTPFDGTQLSEMPEPTQDMGISTTSPIAERFTTVQPSTIDTVLLPNAPGGTHNESKRKGRLVRGRNDSELPLLNATEPAPKSSSTSQNPASPNISNAPNTGKDDAFQTMKMAEQRRAQAESFDKKRSNAKQMVEEQAEESEDEYAGLGGASDDESGGEMDEETRNMLNDEQVNLNERELAAYHADKERADDDKAVRKLLTDIESGMLRRKRGGNAAFDDLSDSEDERQERLLRARQDRESRQRKALLQDENLGKIAENPKKAAFLKAVEDRQGGLEVSFLDDAMPAPTLLRGDSIDEIPNSQPHGDEEISSFTPEQAGEKRKRPLEELNPNKRAHYAERRTNQSVGKKPQSLAEIRETLSFLIDEPQQRTNIQVAATQSSDAEEDVSVSRFADRRRQNSVVDRLFLKRAESTETARSTGRSRLAFHTRGSEDQSVSAPSLLRRATTYDTGDARNVVYASERVNSGKSRSDRDQVRRGGTKKSSVAYFAREAERRQAVDKVEKRRDLERRKATEGRRGILRGLHGGAFE